MDTNDIVEQDSVSPLQIGLTFAGLALGAIALVSWGGALKQKLADRKAQALTPETEIN